jgi:hypothetical protein
MSRPEARPQRALNIAALVILVVLTAWTVWSEAMRRAERRAQEARQLERQEQERQRRAARPRLPARPIDEGEPDPANGRGPVACLLAVDLGDNGQTPGWAAGTSEPASAMLSAQQGRSNTIRFTMGENRFDLPRGAVGVKVSLKWSTTDDMRQADAADALVRLTSAGRPLGANKALNALLPLSLAFTDYGGPTDAWGNGSLIPAEAINSPDFGVDVCVETGSLMSAVNIAGVEITAYERQEGAGANCPPGIQIHRVARFLVFKPLDGHARLALVRRQIWRRSGHVRNHEAPSAVAVALFDPPAATARRRVSRGIVSRGVGGIASARRPPPRPVPGGPPNFWPQVASTILADFFLSRERYV